MHKALTVRFSEASIIGGTAFVSSTKIGSRLKLSQGVEPVLKG